MNSAFVVIKKAYLKKKILSGHSVLLISITWSTLYCLDWKGDKILSSLILSAKLLTSLVWFCDIHFDVSIYFCAAVLFCVLGNKCNTSRNFLSQLQTQPLFKISLHRLTYTENKGKDILPDQEFPKILLLTVHFCLFYVCCGQTCLGKIC